MSLRAALCAVVNVCVANDLAAQIPSPLSNRADTQAIAGHIAADSLTELANHILNRAAFGPRPGDVAQLVRLGPVAWIESQLTPDSIPDKAGTLALNHFPIWRMSVDSAAWEMSTLIVTPRRGGFELYGYNFSLYPRREYAEAPRFLPVYLQNASFAAGYMTRKEASEQQLLEVITDFWENHFSLYGGEVYRGSLLEWTRATIRPHALGRFRDLLGAVLRSPAMLQYLNNDVNAVPYSRESLITFTRRMKDAIPWPQRANVGMNENFARELLELHTLGSTTLFSQGDVEEVARALTGWTHSESGLLPRQSGYVEPFNGYIAPPFFIFDSASHDAEEKRVLGRTLAAGRGMEDADEVLDILASHPATARFIARKLVVRFVSDEPPASLVDNAAATYLRTDGDITQVLRTILLSTEFLSSASHRVKIKTPTEFLLSIRRALDAPADTTGASVDMLIEMGQPPFGHVAPDGWPEAGKRWMTVDAMAIRLVIAERITRGDEPSIRLEDWPEWNRVRAAPLDVQISTVVNELLGGRVSDATLVAMQSVEKEPRETTLRSLVQIALSSPEFQRR